MEQLREQGCYSILAPFRFLSMFTSSLEFPPCRLSTSVVSAAARREELFCSVETERSSLVRGIRELTDRFQGQIKVKLRCYWS